MSRKLKSASNIKQVGELLNDRVNNKAQIDLPLDTLKKYVDSDGITNDYLFGKVDEESVKNLAEGIKREGFQGAINVWDTKDGKYMIFSGHRRAEAMRMLGNNKIPCFIFTYPDNEKDRRRMFLGANIYSRGSAKISCDGGDIYITRQMNYLGNILRNLEGFDGSERQLDEAISNEFGTSRTTVWRFRSLANATDDLLLLESKGLISIDLAAPLARTSKDDQNIIIGIIKRYNEKNMSLSKSNIKMVINKIKEIDNKVDEETMSVAAKTAEINSFVATVIDNKMNEGSAKENDVEKIETPKENKKTSYYNMVKSRADSFVKEINAGKFSELSFEQVNEIKKEYDEALSNLYIFAELMAGRYEGKDVYDNTGIQQEVLRLFSIPQLKKLVEQYTKYNYPNTVSSISEIISEKINETRTDEPSLRLN